MVQGFCFQFFTYKEGFDFWFFWFPVDFIHRIVAPTTCSDYLIFNYLLGCAV